MHRGASAGALALVVCVVGWFGGMPGGTHAASVAALDLSVGTPPLEASSASPSSAVQPAAPPGSVGSYQITIHNIAANSTGTYQQPVAVNSSKFATLLNANWSNALAYYSVNETPVYGWIESSASNTSTDTQLWLRLDSIPADGWQNVTIYCWPKTSFNLSEDGYMGEAPQLSQTYAALDNGWRVFDAYSNFSGVALGAAWTPLGGWAGIVHHGLQVAAHTGTGAIETTLSTSYPNNLTVETYAWMNSTTGPLGLFLAQTPGFSTEYQLFPSSYVLDAGEGSTQGAAVAQSNSTGAWRFPTPPVSGPVDFTQGYHVLGLSWRHSNSTEDGSANYIRFVGQVDATNGPMTQLGLAGYCSANCTAWDVSWIRARDGPSPAPLVTDQAFSPLGVGVVSAPLASDFGHLVTFTCSVSGGTGPYSYAWSFGDGRADLGRVVSHAFSDPGLYNTSCAVTDSSGGSGDSSAEVRVSVNPAVLLFQALPSSLELGASLNLVTNVSGGTPPLTYSYVGLPPGCPGRDSATLSCLPGETGTFAVQVVVTDAVGQQSSALVTISVAPTPPPQNATPFSPAEGYAIAGAVAGVIVLAGVLPVLLWSGRRQERPADPRIPRRPDGSNEDG